MESAVFGTVIAGVLVFVLGQVLLKWLLDPIHQLKKTMADISYTFVRYMYALHNSDVIPPDLRGEVFDKLRQLSGQLYADMTLIPKWIFKYSLSRKVFSLPEKKMVYKSAQNLIATGTWMGIKSERSFDDIVRNMQTACDNLGLYIDPADRIPDENLEE